MSSTILVLLGSAAVGALVSAIITELGKWRERISRREELALAKAVEMTQMNLQTMLQVFKDTGEQDGKIAPPSLILRTTTYL